MSSAPLADVGPGAPGRPFDPYRLGRPRDDADRDVSAYATGHGEGGPASLRVVVAYGMWIYLLSDIILFSCFFAAYIVLKDATAGGPTAREIYDIPRVALSTGLLLASSFTTGLVAVTSARKQMVQTQLWLLATGLLGFAFLLLEADEFAHLIGQGYGPDRSGFLSGFFALVGLHGAHIGAGLLWLGTMMAQIWAKGFRPDICRRLLCFNLFWHALDIVWIGIFTIVYLLGAG